MPLPPVLLNESEADRVREVKARPKDHLLIHEIYFSLQGEGSRAGQPCTFVRTSGCHLRCTYCDTPHAFHQGHAMTVDDVVKEVSSHRTRLVCVTGGEPLLQPEILPMMAALCDAGHTVVLETSGAVNVRNVDERVVLILDIKTPGSGEVERNVWANLERMRPRDEVKIVITDEDDYRWAQELVRDRLLEHECVILLSPVMDGASGLSPTALADWMVRDRFPARLNLQLHKVLWGDKRGV